MPAVVVSRSTQFASSLRYDAQRFPQQHVQQSSTARSSASEASGYQPLAQPSRCAREAQPSFLQPAGFTKASAQQSQPLHAQVVASPGAAHNPQLVRPHTMQSFQAAAASVPSKLLQPSQSSAAQVPSQLLQHAQPAAASVSPQLLQQSQPAAACTPSQSWQTSQAPHQSQQSPTQQAHSHQQFQTCSEGRTEVRRVLSVVCSTCGESFGSSEEANQHWLAVHFPSCNDCEDHLNSSVASSAPTLPEQPCHAHETLPPSPSHQLHSPQQPKDHPDVEMEVRRVLKIVCPTCGESFGSDEEARQHWLAAHHLSKSGSVPLASSEPDEFAPSEQEHRETSSSQQEEHPKVEVRRVLKHLCPCCGQTFGSDEEAKNHWLSVHLPEQNEDTSAPAASANVANEPASHSETTTKASLVEADENGKPVIVRQGERTVVTDADGRQRAFGKETVTSLLAQDKEKLYEWMSDLSGRHLRGLVNEISEQYFQMQDKLFKRREELEQRSKRLGFAFFGLPETCTPKDLDNAYRRFARSMHPDKNGGTELAKERFQAMRAKYEELKEQLGSSTQDDSPTQDIARPQADSPSCREPIATEVSADAETEAATESGTSSEKSEPAAVGEKDEPDAAGEPSPEVSADAPKDMQHESTNSEKAAEDATNDGGAAEGPASSAKGATNAGAAAQGLFYSRSKDVDHLQTASWKLLQQLKTLQQNLLMVEREFEKLLKDERRLS